MKTIAPFALAVLLATQALAHSKISGSSPADGAVLSQPPARIELTFAKHIRLTRVKLLSQDGSDRPLDLGSQTSFGREFSLPVHELGQGVYQIEWRGLGQDGHAMTGGFSFSVE
ncbi:copper resistance protein CopC [Phaeobacter sp. QD34_3]|uniref:copper resistance CopC family protein n=1 Tax=unclassified Phaeobacter TaxID=2621772 RepID=UPI00237F6D11|nr:MULTISPECIES: copper resistance CopC family protein [unclassified Phaeobacter]MDE4134983.1 copper resistance protein CopC [Phaeobacter sp. QD34_3]MDE4138613.1 copper resistance protein CopC [Phaeobacter sp. QD34_24]MDE4176669.1 copper resistance protein CopC [Phaeobacter sp. PT47_59]